MSVKAYAGKTENNAGSATASDLEEKGVTLSSHSNIVLY